MWSILLACAPEPVVPGDPCEDPGNICTWAGIPGMGSFSEEGDRLQTALYLPTDLAFAPDGTAFLLDHNNHRVLQVRDDLVSVVSGTGFMGQDGSGCWEGCDAFAYAWDHPTDVLVDPVNPELLWVVSHQNQLVALDLAASQLTWWAGTGEEAHADGPAEQAAFWSPSSVVAADDGTLYVGDPGNHVIRAISPTGAVSTLAGEPGVPGYDGDGGPAHEAHLRGLENPYGLRLALDGRRLLVADSANGVIRAIDLDTGLIETVAGRYEPDSQNPAPLGSSPPSIEPPALRGYAGDGGPALEATLSEPMDVLVGPDGAMYIADMSNSCVRVVRDGIIETFAGTCTSRGFSGDGGPANAAQLHGPLGLALGGDGAVYVADPANQVILRVAP